MGIGAPAAARAFLAETLSEQPPGKIVIVIPALDLADLLGFPSPAALPELPIGLQATTSLDDALDLLETQTMIRALHLPEPKRHEQWKPIYVLMAMTSRCDPDRLQVVLKLGEGYGVAGLLLGHWWPGVTVSVQEDGTLIPASPGLSALMRDVPIGSMDVTHTIRRLDVLVRHRRPLRAARLTVGNPSRPPRILRRDAT